jgi:polyphosphate kinase
VHVATGNYNQQTARLYTDLSMFTAREDFGEDATSLFNLLTGYSAPARWNRWIVAPLGLHEAVLGLIARETEHARQGRPAGIVAKMNSLVDADVITALYAASQAGVKIELLVRGICCLRPGVKGISDNIRVQAVIDRFLEHSRLFHFKNGGEDEVFASSADWMPRNFRRRVEMMWPIVDEQLKRRTIDEILGTMAGDSGKSWLLDQSGTYRRVKPDKDAKPVRSQARFMELARDRLRESDSMLSRQLAPAPSPVATFEKLRRKGKKKKKRDQRRDD